jgi:hypothetical protein
MGGKEVVSKVKKVNKKIKAECSDQEHKEIHNISEKGVHSPSNIVHEKSLCSEASQ